MTIAAPGSSMRFPAERRLARGRIMTFNDVDEIDRAARDAVPGDAIKPVLRMS